MLRVQARKSFVVRERGKFNIHDHGKRDTVRGKWLQGMAEQGGAAFGSVVIPQLALFSIYWSGVCA